jgi:hypothetical protein
MAQEAKVKKQTNYEAIREQNYVAPGSAQHESMLSIGYNLTVDEAKTIISDWEKDHKSWPLEEVRKARAFLAALSTKPVAVSTDPGWQRSTNEE